MTREEIDPKGDRMNTHRRVRALSATAIAAGGCALMVATATAPANAASLLRLHTALRGAAHLREAPARPRALTAQFRTVDFPGANGTGVNFVNNHGTLLGTYFNAGLQSFGFVERGHQLTSFNYPGTTGVTSSSGMNNRDDAVGAYTDANSVFHGWVRSADGTFTQIDDPAAGTGAFEGTQPAMINDAGELVGAYFDSSGISHGFVDYHGTFTTVDFPGTSEALGQGTTLTAINDSGAIVGYYNDSAGVVHGFVEKHGAFTTIDAPGAGTAPGQGTSPAGISSSGVIDGGISNDAGFAGWVLYKRAFSSLNDPNAAPGASLPLGLSSNGRYVSGEYTDNSGVNHGFVATLSR